MLWTPQKGLWLREHSNGSVGSDTAGIGVTTDASASGTKGAVAEIFASTAFDAYWVIITVANVSNTATASEGTMDILIGASTEEILIPDLLVGYAGSPVAGAPKVWHFPLYIPAGSRISAKACGVRLSTTYRVRMDLYGGGCSPFGRCGQKVVTYGVATPPNGTSITVGANQSEGSWTQITASTSEDHFALVPSFQISADTTTNSRNYGLDIGIGSATEEEVMGDYLFSGHPTELISGPHNPMPVFQDIPSGTRLSMRAQNNGTNDGAYNCAIHAVS